MIPGTRSHLVLGTETCVVLSNLLRIRCPTENGNLSNECAVCWWKIEDFALLIIHNDLDTTRVCYATECISIDYISVNVSLVIIFEHRRASYYKATATCKWTWMRRIPTCVCGISIVSLTRIILHFSEEAKTLATHMYYGNTFKLSLLVLLCFYCNHGNMYLYYCLCSKRKHAQELNTVGNHTYIERPTLTTMTSTSKLVENDADDYDDLPPVVRPKPAEQPQ